MGQQQLWVQLEGFARDCHASLNPIEVAYRVANDGRRLIDCDRVSVGIRYGRRVTVELAPVALGMLDQLVDHRQAGVSTA